MIEIARNITNKLARKPKTLFLIDSAGAMITAALLFFVLRNFNHHFGMPIEVLTYLALVAACFCVYSSVCYFLLKDYWTPFIRAISIANLLYCILTIGLLIFYYPRLTLLGATYFLTEVVVICGLVYIELNVATELKKNRAT